MTENKKINHLQSIIREVPKYAVILPSFLFLEPILSRCTLSLRPENIRKPYGFLMFSWGRERMH